MITAAAIVAAFGWYLRRPDAWLILRVRLGAPTAGRFDWQSARARVFVAIAGTALVSTAVPNAATQAAVVAFAATGIGAATLRRQAVVRRQAVEFRAEIARILSAVAAELRAGVDPLAGLRAALADAPAAWDPVRMAPLGDVAPAVRVMSSLPGGESLATVAAAWHIAEQTGSPLATVLDRLSASMRAEVELDRDIAVEAAPARATGRLMAIRRRRTASARSSDAVLPWIMPSRPPG